jgi:hypothetical protein
MLLEAHPTKVSVLPRGNSQDLLALVSNWLAARPQQRSQPAMPDGDGIPQLRLCEYFTI